ncbi:MAG: hypothetical protein B7Y45_08490 [Sphingomonas sp. 28-66-16]|nr:MAG: hypothetical protein B7Y45_08490 [Sphingomonas sp. 28-66-16]
MIAAMTFTRFSKSEQWTATVTPLASIIGSGFLISGPLLAHEFGGAALPAMAVLLLLAYAVGGVIRWNIVHVENYLESAPFNDPISWTARLTQLVLAAAYAISVAYYLKLLAAFALKAVTVPEQWRDVIANAGVTAIIVVLMVLAFGGGLRRIERIAHATVAVKIGIIAGMLAGLAGWWVVNWGTPLSVPPAIITWRGIPLLLGLLITVQGFETSRYLGQSYDQAMRVRTMRHAQWISTVIYLGFIGLLTPFLGAAAKAEGVAGIIDVMRLVAAPLVIFVFIAALSSQLSAAVADSIGSGGLMNEISQKVLSLPAAFALSGALSILVVWLTDPFEVVALSSRAFAVFYAMQCALGIAVSWRRSIGGWPLRIGFAALALICIVAALVGAPAES